MSEYIKKSYGPGKWKQIQEKMEIKEENFGIADIFPEGQILKMGKTAMKLLEMKDEEFYEGMGVYFVALATDLGYGLMLQSVGRRFRDFFVNLDNLHDYLKFTFQRMKAPSFFIADETPDGMLMEYRSKRRGFQYYVQGQVKEISKNFALEIKKLEIVLKKQEVVFDTVVNTFEMKFENEGYKQMVAAKEARKDASMPIRAATLFEMFPFCVLFNPEMNVTMLGVALRMIIPKIIGEGLSSWFELVKPLVEFKWDVINSRINSMFELATQEEVDKLGKSDGSSSREFSSELMLLDDDVDKTLHIKGQMVFMKEWDAMLFLACPMLPKLENLIWTGLFVNDLSMHDYSRDIMLATTQEQIQMKMLLDAAEKKAALLESQQKKLGEIMKKSDDLISQMLPKKVADDLAKGKSNEEVCEAYEMVTMLFSDIVTFTVICSHLKPLQVVQLLNNMYTLFDFLCDQNAVYKVETIGDAYLIVAGCPTKAANHAIKICDMAFDMMDGISMLKDPSNGEAIHMRIGCHSGPVVAGVVGLKMPRFCLFGINVGLTEKFESNSKPDQIHISEKTQELLSSQYKVEERTDEGLSMKVGGYRSFFLNSKENRRPLQPAIIKALLPTADEGPKIDDKKKKDDKKKEEPKKADAAPAAAASAAPAAAASAPAPAADSSAPAASAAPTPSAAPAESSAPSVEAAPAPSDGGGGGGGGGGEDAPAGEAAPAEEEAAPAEEAAEAETAGDAGDEGHKADVEVVASQQCCGGIKKSSVCTLI